MANRELRNLLEGHQEKLLRAEREIEVAVRLARDEGGFWDEIARVLGLPAAEVRARFDQPPQNQD